MEICPVCDEICSVIEEPPFENITEYYYEVNCNNCGFNWIAASQEDYYTYVGSQEKLNRVDITPRKKKREREEQ